MKRKSAKQRAKEFANKPYVKRILGNNWTPDKQLLAELEKYFERWLIDHPGIEINQTLYNKIANMISGGIKTNLYSRYKKLEDLQPHSLEHYQILFGDDLGLQKYQSRTQNLSKINKISDVNIAIDAFLNLKIAKDVIKKENLSNDQITELRKLFTSYQRSAFKDSWALVIDIVRYHAPDYVSRFNICKNNSPNSEAYLQARYGNDQSLIDAWYAKRQSFAENNFSNIPRYWILQGLDVETAKLAAQSIQTSRAEKSGNKLRGVRHGPRTVEYWISKGNDENQAKELVSAWQRRDLEWFIALYGNVDGTERYQQMIKQRTQTWQKKSKYDRQKINQTKGRTFQQLIESHGIDQAIEIIKKRTSGNSKISKESIEFFKDLDNLIEPLGAQSVTGYKGIERFVRFNNDFTWLDYYINGKIIEYHGSFWHADPRLFEAEQIHSVINMPCKEIWNRDKDRIDNLKKLGYTVLVIWSKDVADDRQRELDKAKQFIRGQL